MFRANTAVQAASADQRPAAAVATIRHVDFCSHLVWSRKPTLEYPRMVNETETPGDDDGHDGRGQPAHEPTAESRARVESLSSYGVPQKSIAALIGLGSKMTLRKHY